jgi:hypothetical protein
MSAIAWSVAPRLIGAIVVWAGTAAMVALAT